MSFGQRLRERRKELGISQGELAKALGVSVSAVSNYESGQNAMREEVLLRLFQALDVEPNYLYQDAFSGKSFTCSAEEQALVRTYRGLRSAGRQAIRSLADALPILDQKIHGYAHPDAVLTAVETRSSCPLRILRDEGGQSAVRGLWPCGEGAGYAGGIMSAAADGLRAAEQLLAAL